MINNTYKIVRISIINITKDEKRLWNKREDFYNLRQRAR